MTKGMRSYTRVMSLEVSMSGVFLRKGEAKQRHGHTREGWHVMTQGETEVGQSQAKECQGLPENHRKQG